jgi:hypothetical protein
MLHIILKISISYVFYIVLRPSIWSENAYQVYKHSFVNQIRKEITVFIKRIVRSLNLSDTGFELITIDHTDVTEGVLKFKRSILVIMSVLAQWGLGLLRKYLVHTAPN